MTEKTEKTKQEIVPGVLIAVLSISSWTNSGRDSDAELELAHKHSCNERRIRVTKELLSKDNCPELAHVKALERKARDIWRDMTLPWMDRGGGRILAAEVHGTFLAKMHDVSSELEKAWKDLAKVFDRKVADEQGSMGSMFKKEDYPTGEQLLKMFNFDIDIMPLPKVKDIRLSVRSNELKKIKQDYENMVQRKLDQAVKAPWIRVHKVISHMMDRLEAKDLDPSSRLYESVVFNIKDLADLLPDLNITKDPELDKMALDLKRKLTMYDVGLLKESPLLRKELQNNGRKLLIKAEDKIYGRTDSEDEDETGKVHGGDQKDQGGIRKTEEPGSMQDGAGGGSSTPGTGEDSDAEEGAEGLVGKGGF